MKKAYIFILLIALFASPCFSEEKTYLLPEPVKTALINYLIKQPYEEVAVGVQALMGLKEAPAPVEPKPEIKK